MNKPSLDILMTKVDSKYTLVVAAAKRARQLIEGEEKLINIKTNKPVSVALAEVASDLIKYERTKVGIK